MTTQEKSRPKDKPTAHSSSRITTRPSDAPDFDADAELNRTVPERFSVNDRDSANWLVRRILEAERAIQDAKAWLDRVVRRAERDREFFLRQYGAELEVWAQEELKKLKGRSKSIDLPSGRVGFRSFAEKLVVEDECATLAWAEGHCRTAVVITRKLSKTAIGEHFKESGELPYGTRLEPAQERFYIR